MGELIWTDEQVVALNAHQSAGQFHPFTCGGDRGDDAHRAYQAEHGGDFGQLVATREGWKCPVCNYRQAWAHGFMFGGATKDPTSGRSDMEIGLGLTAEVAAAPTLPRPEAGDDLAQRARDLLEWYRTGILPEGALARMARERFGAEDEPPRAAERQTIRDALRTVSSPAGEPAVGRHESERLRLALGLPSPPPEDEA